jgi:hypothetical protein
VTGDRAFLETTIMATRIGKVRRNESVGFMDAVLAKLGGLRLVGLRRRPPALAPGSGHVAAAEEHVVYYIVR